MVRLKLRVDFTRLCLLVTSAVWLFLGLSHPLAAQSGPPGCPTQAPGPNPYNPCNWDAHKIMAEIENPHDDLVTVAAHRGTHSLAGTTQAPGVAENSLEAIGIAAQEGWESIEIDVKVTSDGVPVLSHDKVWGRETCVNAGSTSAGIGYFYPFNPPLTPGLPTPTPAGSANNPLVDTTSYATLINTSQDDFFLRDTVGIWEDVDSRGRTLGCADPIANQSPLVPTLVQVYQFIKANNIQMVVTLDIQTPKRASATWAYLQKENLTDANGNPFYETTMWKIPAALFLNVAAYEEDFLNIQSPYASNSQLINFNPVFHTSGIAPAGKCMSASDIDDIDDVSEDLGDAGDPTDGVEPGCPNSFGSEANMIAWLTAFSNSPAVNLSALEISMKDAPPTGILNSVRDWAKTYSGRVFSLSTFNPVGEYLISGNSTPQFFSSSNGSCCEQLSQFLFNNPNNIQETNPGAAPYPDLPYDHADNRTDINFVVNQLGANVITTDAPGPLTTYLQSQGLRNTTYLQAPVDPHCTPGVGQYPGCDARGTTVYTLCVPENGNCTYTGARNIAYGANGKYNYWYGAYNSAACNDSTLGPDPIYGVVKACYYGPAIINWHGFSVTTGVEPGQWAGTYCADEGGSCPLNYASAYNLFGLDLKFNFGQYAIASQPCTLANYTVDGADPAPDYVKTCFYAAQLQGTEPAGYVFCSSEGSTCTFTGAARTAFGANGIFTYKAFTASSPEASSGGAPCTIAEFGVDPTPDVAKHCYYQYAQPGGPEIGPPPTLPSGASTCDIYASGGTPCVAAHSTTRALFAGYSGRLYQVTRASDGTTQDVVTLATGGYANAAAQNTFCTGTTCVISKIYDQSAYGNDLAIEGPGQAVPNADSGAVANALPITVHGNAAYGVDVTSGVGYRNNATNGVSKNQSPEGMYMVTSGTNVNGGPSSVNGGCCFDYGNAEENSSDNGNGHMDAINFGNFCGYPPCTGSGPWVQADMENGQYMGNGNNPGDQTQNSDFVTAMLKNNATTTFALKGGNAQSGTLTTEYSGSLPTVKSGYVPMSLEGAIVLGTGGDNSDWGIGSFFEGAMTSGYPTDATEAAVQANIVAAGYIGSSGTPGSVGTVSTDPAGDYTGPSDPGGPGPQDGFASPATEQPNVIMATKPALADFDGTLYVAFEGVGVQNDLYLTSSPTGTNFPTATRYTNIQTSSAPALATFNNQLFMAFRGLNVNNDFYITSSPTGGNFPSATQHTNIQMGGAPAMAVFNNQLYVAFQANDGSHTLHVTASSDGVTWPTAWPINNVQIGSDPAMAVFNGMLYIAFRANDPSNDVWVAYSPDGINFTSQKLTGQTMGGSSSPALVASNGVLYYIYTADDQGHEMLVSSSTDGLTWQGPAAYLAIQTGATGPGAAAFVNGVSVGFQSNDARNVLFVTSKATEPTVYSGPNDGGTAGFQDKFANPAAQQPNDIMGTKPAFAAFKGNVYVGFEGVGQNNDLYITSSPTGSNFPVATQYPNLQSSSAPALAAFNTQLYVAFRGLGVNNDLYTTSSPTGTNFPTATQHTNIEMGGAPAMALFNNQLYIAFQANDSSHTLFLTHSTDGVNWPDAYPIANVKIGSDPAMAVLNGILYIAFRANDLTNDVWLASSPDGVNFTSFKLANQTMAWGSSPALAVINQDDANVLYYFYEAADSLHEMLVTTSSDGVTWPSPAVYGAVQMGLTGPAATGFGNSVYAGFQSYDARNVLFVTGQTDSGAGGPAGAAYLVNSTLYPRLIKLSHGPTSTNGYLVASTNDNVFLSKNNGGTWTFTGTVPSQIGSEWGGGTIYEMPQTVGSLQAGTLLFASTYFMGSPTVSMIEVYTSTDQGNTWIYSTTPVSGGGSFGSGIWEPEFEIASDGALVMFFSNETDSCCSQKLSEIRTYNGTTWQDASNVVASSIQADRPGMARVSKLVNGSFFMTYELCGPAACTAYYRTSTDGWNFGTTSNTGTKIQTSSGQYFEHAPANFLSPSVFSVNGALLVIGQSMFESNGSVSPANGLVMFANQNNGVGPWYVVAAPVPVTNANVNGCGNYSSAILPMAEGSTTSIWELATATDANNLCVSYLANESWNQLPLDGSYYAFQNVYAGLCLDDYQGGKTNGTTADLATCTNANGLYDEPWQVHSQGNGYFTIQNPTTSLCLDDNGGSATPGNKVVLWTCTAGDANQNWRFMDVGLNQYELINQAAGEPLDDSGGSKTPGNPLDIWTDLGFSSQHWTLH